MTAFGALGIVCALLGWGAPDGAIRVGMAVGLAMVAAGAAAAQGRRSLRLSGHFVGTIVPIVAGVFWGWRAVGSIRHHNGAPTSIWSIILLSVLSIGALVTLLALLKLRAGDSIGERGYSITPLASKTAEAPVEESRKR
jgi:hypothetical protein